MAYITTRVENHIGYVVLQRPPMNLINFEFMDEFMAAHRELQNNPEVWGVICHSTVEGFFSNGLEPDLLLERDLSGRVAVFEKLLELVLEVYAFPKPHISAIEGHAMAGGAVLAILSDWRFMGDGRGRIAFSEVAVGLTIPRAIIRLIESVTGPGPLRRIAMLGGALKAKEALELGLIDQMCESGTTVREAEKYLRRIFELPLASVRSVKQILRAENLAMLKKREGLEALGEFLTSHNFVEGLSAVRERRRPQFKNP